MKKRHPRLMERVVSFNLSRLWFPSNTTFVSWEWVWGYSWCSAYKCQSSFPSRPSWALPQILKGKHVNDFEYNYDKFIPTTIQIKFSKYVLGVHKSASNLAVLGDLGFYPLSVNALKSSVEYWLHILKAKDNNLISRAYQESLKLRDSLFDKFKTFLNLIGFEHIW